MLKGTLALAVVVGTVGSNNVSARIMVVGAPIAGRWINTRVPLVYRSAKRYHPVFMSNYPDRGIVAPPPAALFRTVQERATG